MYQRRTAEQAIIFPLGLIFENRFLHAGRFFEIPKYIRVRGKSPLAQLARCPEVTGDRGLTPSRKSFLAPNRWLRIWIWQLKITITILAIQSSKLA